MKHLLILQIHQNHSERNDRRERGGREKGERVREREREGRISHPDPF
jgi:hypothetical protein